MMEPDADADAFAAPARRAYDELRDANGFVVGAAIRTWISTHPRYGPMDRDAHARAWEVADTTKRGALTELEVAHFLAELERQRSPEPAAPPASLSKTASATCVAAAAGFAAGGPPGALVLGGLAATSRSGVELFASISRRLVHGSRRRRGVPRGYS